MVMSSKTNRLGAHRFCELGVLAVEALQDDPLGGGVGPVDEVDQRLHAADDGAALAGGLQHRRRLALQHLGDGADGVGVGALHGADAQRHLGLQARAAGPT
ncbi:hypothetical protein GCM10025868_41480 [Angustibacter aerolatus]|uniref:Uncharacterized protein n=1 Tax=Angustibacter aerolatus TaxID=1162965 RepID=A0ABQ6JLL7_9ACTN|nr:hypothetical protein GCM10025868_41480 [Angustibacter aerolatus]